MRRITVSRLLVVAMLLSGVFLFSGCGLFSGPQNVFAPSGEVARDQKNLFFLTMYPALAILILVEVGLLYICLRYRRKKNDSGLPTQVHGNNRLELMWTIAPAVLLALFIVPTIGGIVKLGRTPKDAMVIDVNGVQWAWQFSYADPAGGTTPIMAPIGEMHIPVNHNIEVKLHSNNVIHSFWVPKLAGKTDVIPSRENHMWFNAFEAGTYSGQCAEFCGLGHGDMRFTVVAESQEDFDAWLKGQAAAQSGTEPLLAFQGD